MTQADGKEGGPPARKGQTKASTAACMATLAASCCTRVCASVGIKKRERVWKSKWQKGGLYNENSYSEEKEKAGKADMVRPQTPWGTDQM